MPKVRKSKVVLVNLEVLQRLQVHALRNDAACLPNVLNAMDIELLPATHTQQQQPQKSQQSWLLTYVSQP
eukprot:5001814-Amphidinium_carterae.1